MNLPAYKKIGLVYGILVILLVVALGVRFLAGNRSQNTQPGGKTGTFPTGIVQQTIKGRNLPGKLSLVIDKPSYKVGDQIELTILYSAPAKILDGIDIVLRFDPTIINALGFTPVGSFRIYPRKDVDNKEGVVKLTALDPASTEPLPPDKVSLGRILLQAQKEGTVNVNFDFITGVTSKTTMTEAGTSANILGEATGVTIRVE